MLPNVGREGLEFSCLRNVWPEVTDHLAQGQLGVTSLNVSPKVSSMEQGMRGRRVLGASTRILCVAYVRPK